MRPVGLTVWRDALRSRKAHVLLVVAAVYIAWEVWLSIAASTKLVDLAATGERANILVTLSFPPERFHVQLLQGYGRVSGSEDNAVALRGVKRADIESIARRYWVRRVEPLKTGG